MPKALIVDRDPGALRALADLAEREGFDALCTSTLAEARLALGAEAFSTIFLDASTSNGDGWALLEELQRGPRRTPVIVMADEPNVSGAVSAMQHADAVDYLPKPFHAEQRRAVREHLRALRARIARSGPEARKRFGPMLGSSPTMLELYEVVARVAATEATTLVIGESGTGKELVARTLHRRSPRRERTLVAINCGAIPESLIESELFGHEKGAFSGATRTRRGVFERAHRGTLFLDEIAEMPIDLQAKLLRVLETGTYYRVGGDVQRRADVRLIAATNRDPREAVAEGRLREDLLYRLSVFPVVVPPLRDRPGDVELLAEHFLAQLNRSAGTRKHLSPEALAGLRLRPWPGNVRQLQNAVHRAFILADGVLGVEHFAAPGAGIEPARPAEPLPVQRQLHLPPQDPGDGGEDGRGRQEPRTQEEAVDVLVGCSLEEVTRQLTVATLERYGGDKRRAARVLGISLKTLYNRLKRYREADAGDAGRADSAAAADRRPADSDGARYTSSSA